MNLLNAFLSPGVISVIELSAYANYLTKISHQISQFTTLMALNLHSNQITFIPPGIFIITL